MTKIESIGDHARIYSSGLQEAFGRSKGLGHLTDQCVIVMDMTDDKVALDFGEWGVRWVSREHTYQTMPAAGFEDVPDFMNDTAPTGLPTVKEELDRKTGDTLDWLIQRHKSGAISDEACSIASDALFMAVAGLVDKSLIEVITALGSYLPSSNPAKQVRIFAKGEETLAVRWAPGSDELVISSKGGTKLRSYPSVVEARQAFLKVGDALQKGGYLEQI